MHLEIMLGLVGLCSGADVWSTVSYLCMRGMFTMDPSLKDSKLLRSNQSSTEIHCPILIHFTPLCLDTS